jgi:hypothetical protein
METMAASNKTSVSEEAESNSNEAMDTNSSGGGSRGEKDMDASYVNSVLRESTDSSVSSPGRESRSDGEDREQFTGDQSNELISDAWDEKNGCSGEVHVTSDVPRREEGNSPISEALKDNRALMNSSHGWETHQEASHQPDSTTGVAIGDVGCRSRRPKYIDNGETELDAPGALLQASFTGRSGQIVVPAAVVADSSEAVEAPFSIPEPSTNPSFEIYADLSMVSSQCFSSQLCA